MAWRQINRPGAPATLEAALQHRAYGPCIRSLALSLGRRGLDRAPPAQPPAPREAPAPRVLRLGTVAPTRYIFDGKRAAANDHHDE